MNARCLHNVGYQFRVYNGIGVIYGVTRGTGTTIFDERYRTPNFQDEKV